MFRIGLKFPCNGLNRVKKHGYSRLYLTARYYETRTRVKCESDGRLCKDIKLISRYSGHKYSTDASKSEKRIPGTLTVLGVATIGTIGILALAKNYPGFRATLEEYIPGTDKTIKVIFQEEANYLDFVRSFFESLKETIVNMVAGDSSKKEAAPKPAFEPLVDKPQSPINEPYAEIRLSKEKGKNIEVVEEKPTIPPKHIPEQLMPANLVELEKNCSETAAKAIVAYSQAVCAIQDYNQDVIKVIEGAGTTVGAHVWERLKEATEKRKTALQNAEEHANNAVDSLKRMYLLINEPAFEAPSHMKTAARRNIKKILDDVDNAKKEYEEELQSGNITERYWKQIKDAREYFDEELKILFPTINLQSKKVSLGAEAFDLFVLHMYNKVNNIQKEIIKCQTVNESKLRTALRATGEIANKEKLDTLICFEVEKEKRRLEEEFNKKLLEEQKRMDDELRQQLKLQSQIHTDHLREALQANERDVQRQFNRALSEQVEAESVKYKTQLASVIGRLRGLETALKARMDEEKAASNAQILWSACQALARAVKAAPPGTRMDQAVRPLEPEIQAVSKAARKEDPLVRAAIQGIPEEASKRGVFPEDALRARFLQVENVARRLAMVPEGGAALPIYLLSYLQSFLIIRNPNPISKKELADEPIDVDSLSTYDILHRARYWLDRGDFKMTLRYMNLLKGAPRSIARDWMNEVRILLETQQAIDALLAYAGSSGLVFLDTSNSSASVQP